MNFILHNQEPLWAQVWRSVTLGVIAVSTNVVYLPEVLTLYLRYVIRGKVDKPALWSYSNVFKLRFLWVSKLSPNHFRVDQVLVLWGSSPEALCVRCLWCSHSLVIGSILSTALYLIPYILIGLPGSFMRPYPVCFLSPWHSACLLSIQGLHVSGITSREKPHY